MSELFANAVVYPVFFSRGKMANDQRMKYKRAPFDIVIIDGVALIQPLAPSSSDKVLGQLGNDDLQAQDLYRGDLGYYMLPPIIMDENEMGDGSDTWKGLNAISDL